MRAITLYGLKTCDTCRKAIKALEDAGVSVERVDVREAADLDARLPAWLDAVGAERLVNTRSTTWRGLDAGQSARAQSDPADLLKAHPALIKRPVIEAGGSTHVGWTRDVQAALGL